MRSFAISAVAAIALVQFCPAPILAIPEAVAAGIGAITGVIGAASGVAGAVEGGISAAHGRRSRINRPIARQEQNQLAWQLCHDQLGSSTLTFSAPSVGNVLVQGIPPACMTLATVLTGTVDAGNPVPEGTDSILFQNLSDSDIQAIQNALSTHGA